MEVETKGQNYCVRMMALSVAEMGSSNHWRIYFVTALTRCSEIHVLDKSATVRCCNGVGTRPPNR